LIIKACGLTKRYGELTAVKNISLDVAHNEVFGFLGPNGAGKTTTIHILCTLVLPTEGQAWIAGFDIVKEASRVRQSIGLVFQEPTLDENLTAYENLSFHGMIYGMTGPHLKNRIREVMELAQLWDRRDHLVKTFSGGMKRRLEIARGLIHFPQIVFLDEPTIGLDPQTRRNVWEYIHEMRWKYGTTIFMTTHYLDEAENCDRIAIIDEGEIIACDSPARLKQMFHGDLIKIKSQDKFQLQRILQDKFIYEAELYEEGISLQVENADTVLPEILRELSEADIETVSLVKPSLDDVFIKLTGRTIREENVRPDDGLRQVVRMHKRR